MNIDQFRQAAGISRYSSERWFVNLTEAMDEFQINTPYRQAAFIAQVGTESAGFSRLAESLNYSVQGLLSTFPTRVSLAQGKQLGRRPGEKSVPIERQEEIANLVYGGRYGNVLVGDGWKYRGRGLKQITFHDNYRDCGAALGLDLVNDPDLLLIDANAARSAGWYWVSRGCNQLADRDDFLAVTRAVNGGINGLADRRERLVKAKSILFA